MSYNVDSLMSTWDELDKECQALQSLIGSPIMAEILSVFTKYERHPKIVADPMNKAWLITLDSLEDPELQYDMAKIKGHASVIASNKPNGEVWYGMHYKAGDSHIVVGLRVGSKRVRDQAAKGDA